MCETCKRLLERYDGAVTAFMQATKELSVAVGGDFQYAFEEYVKLRHACHLAKHELHRHILSDRSITRLRRLVRG